jgi:uncharacterized membrane protein (DUF2068 family)
MGTTSSSRKATDVSAVSRSRGGRTLRGVALVESAKGLLVLFAGAGLLSLTPQEVEAAAVAILESFRLNPSSGYPRVFLDLASQTSNTQLWWLAMGAMAYASIRLAEAYGLWRDRAWAKWLGAVSGALYIPYEIYGLTQTGSVTMAVVLAINVAIVGFLSWSLWSGGRNRAPVPLPPDGQT